MSYDLETAKERERFTESIVEELTLGIERLKRSNNTDNMAIHCLSDNGLSERDMHRTLADVAWGELWVPAVLSPIKWDRNKFRTAVYSGLRGAVDRAQQRNMKTDPMDEAMEKISATGFADLQDTMEVFATAASKAGTGIVMIIGAGHTLGELMWDVVRMARNAYKRADPMISVITSDDNIYHDIVHKAGYNNGLFNMHVHKL